MKLLTIIAGLFIVGWKGVSIPFRAEDRARWFSDWLGFTAPDMAEHWDRFDEPGADFGHLATNIWAEWNRNDAQRGIKVALGLGLVGWIIAALAIVTVFVI